MNYRPLPEPSYAKIGKEKIECNKCKPNCYVNAMKGAGNKMLVSFNYYNVFSTLWIKTFKPFYFNLLKDKRGISVLKSNSEENCWNILFMLQTL